MTPPPVELAGRGGVPDQEHPRETPESDARAEPGARLFLVEPAVVEDARLAAVDLLARRQISAPFAVRSAAAGAVVHQHVAVLALVADDRVVRDARVDRLAVLGVLRHRADDGCHNCGHRKESESVCKGRHRYRKTKHGCSQKARQDLRETAKARLRTGIAWKASINENNNLFCGNDNDIYFRNFERKNIHFVMIH